jgi:hypothetical protein
VTGFLQGRAVMKSIEINTDNGTIILPSEYAVSPSLTQEAFRKGEMFSNAQSRTAGTFPWIHYSFSGGSVSGRNLLVSLCFYDQMIVSTHMTVDFYPPGSKDWSDYSLDVETSTKQCHDALLEEILGTPTESDRLAGVHLDPAHETLARPLKWDFPWGTVRSSYDFKGGGAFIIVGYGNRQEEATQEYWKETSRKS